MTTTNTATGTPASETRPPVVFAYEKPAVSGEKVSMSLARSDFGSMGIQVLDGGGENNLHAHAHGDGFWFVLAGRLRFYTTNDEVVCEVGPNEGVVMPRGFPYWFESVPTESGEQVEVIRFGASDEPMAANRPPDRINLEALKPNQDPRLATA